MTLFVDADSCPVRVREIICKTASRLHAPVFFAANRFIPIQKNAFTHLVVTASSDQAADKYIIEHAAAGDLVITRDIPLVKVLVDAGIRVINDRGTIYTAENIGERLSVRNFMFELYASGLIPEKTSSFGKKEIAAFAQALDKETRQLMKNVSVLPVSAE